MSLIQSTISVQGGPEEVVKNISRAMKFAFKGAGEHWRDKILPAHFTPRGAKAYGYVGRSKRHMLRKARKYHHQNPLEYTGAMRQQIFSTRVVRATGKGATVPLRGPKYLYAYHKNRNEPHKGEELTATTEADIKALEKVFGDHAALYMKNEREYKARTIK